jgi:hypothetical protein
MAVATRLEQGHNAGYGVAAPPGTFPRVANASGVAPYFVCGQIHIRSSAFAPV